LEEEIVLGISGWQLAKSRQKSAISGQQTMGFSGIKE
jgi:hypothetical protein